MVTNKQTNITPVVRALIAEALHIALGLRSRIVEALHITPD